MASAGRDLAHALDPVLWAVALGFDADPWQADVLRGTAGRVLLNCSRQSGKSTVAALLSLHTALYRPGALALLLSPSLRQSSELFRKVAGYYQQVVDAVPPEAESALRLELGNGSRVVSLPGREQTVRGFSGVDLLVIDEAARVPDDLYCAVRPMLAVSGGRLVTLSTPFGKRGWWWKEWNEGGDAWQRVLIPATMCPRIPAEFLAEEREHLGEWWYQQEYLCEFLDAQTAAFTYDMVQSALTEGVETWAL
jgi:hypothetical protein